MMHLGKLKGLEFAVTGKHFPRRIKTMKSELKLAMQNVLDTFTGADGGGDFMSFRHLIEDMELQADNGNQYLLEVLAPA